MQKTAVLALAFSLFGIQAWAAPAFLATDAAGKTYSVEFHRLSRNDFSITVLKNQKKAKPVLVVKYACFITSTNRITDQKTGTISESFECDFLPTTGKPKMVRLESKVVQGLESGKLGFHEFQEKKPYLELQYRDIDTNQIW